MLKDELTSNEQLVMNVLQQYRDRNQNQITDIVNQTKPMSRVYVCKILKKLIAKGIVRYSLSGNGHEKIYRIHKLPTVQENPAQTINLQPGIILPPPMKPIEPKQGVQQHESYPSNPYQQPNYQNPQPLNYATLPVNNFLEPNNAPIIIEQSGARYAKFKQDGAMYDYRLQQWYLSGTGSRRTLRQSCKSV